LRQKLEKNSNISPTVFDQIVEALQKETEDRKTTKKTKVIERMPASKYYTYLVRFGEIYKEMLGMNYFPGVRDLNYIRSVVITLNSKNLAFDEYVRWLCRSWRFQVLKMGTISLRKYLNFYLESRLKGDL
jgi:hypothetical protein